MNFESKFFISLFVVIILLSCGNKRNSSTGILTTVDISDTLLNLGSIKYGVPITCQFRITNTGDAPLLIKHVEPGCGCTQTNWTKQPIRKGNAAIISVEFDGKAFGRFKKELEIFFNTADGSKVVWFTGETKE